MICWLGSSAGRLRQLAQGLALQPAALTELLGLRVLVLHEAATTTALPDLLPALLLLAASKKLAGECCARTASPPCSGKSSVALDC